MSQRLHTLAASILTAVLLAAAATAAAQDEPPAKAAPLTIETIAVEPANPGADTLCKLRVTLRNVGTEKASQLGFDVRLNGQSLSVYGNQLFMYPVAPGETAEIPLYNFWTTETGRSMPKDGKLTVEVTLREARWWKVAMEGEVETWTPIGDVDGLPVSKSVTLQMTVPGS